MKLPDDWKKFYDDMCNRAIEYIKISYWSIKEEDFYAWRNNFSTDEEKFLAAILIYRLIYRNKEAYSSMFTHFIDIQLPEILSKENIYNVDTLDKFRRSLRKKDPKLKIRFTAVEGVDEKTGKSGPYLLRDVRQYLPIHTDLIISKDAISSQNKEQVKAIIIVDDMIGSGEQFGEYLNTIKEHLKDYVFIYCPFVAHQEGLKNIEKISQGVIIAPIETIYDKYNFFDDSFMPKIVKDTNIKEIKSLYESMMKKKTKIKALYGKGEQSLAYVFSFSTPNNCLPIYWYDEETDFKKLFSR